MKKTVTAFLQICVVIDIAFAILLFLLAPFLLANGMMGSVHDAIVELVNKGVIGKHATDAEAYASQLQILLSVYGFLCIFFGVAFIAGAFVAFRAKYEPIKSLFIANIVFGILGNSFAILTGILGLVMIKKQIK